MVTCALLAALRARGMSVQSFKCGPDYIDPMFHQQMLGVPSRNLDLFLQGEAGVRRTLSRQTAELALVEGAMGFYDGVGGTTHRASAWHVADTLGLPVLLAVRAKGASEGVTIVRHVLRNALIPIVTLVGMQIGSLLGGAVVIEQIFSLPGLGLMTLTGINNRDYPVVQGCVLFIAFIYVLVNLIVDLLYAYIDPRISYD